MKQKFILLCCAMIGIPFCVCVLILNIGKEGALRHSILSLLTDSPLLKSVVYLPTPWRCVGGCGESSGSISGESQIKWIGKGISGTLFDAEAIFSESMLADSSIYKPDKFDENVRLKTTSLLLSLFYHPRIADLKLSFPLTIKEGYGRMTGPFGDAALDISRQWGMEGKLRTALVLTFPTGGSGIPENMNKALHPDLQLGTGMFGGALRMTYTIDRDWGFVCLGGAYSGSYFAMITKEYGYDPNTGDVENGKVYSVKKIFELSRNGWGGLNDRGVINPDFVSFFTDFDFKTPALSHGLSLSFSFPLRNGLGDDWVVTRTGWSSNKATEQVYLPTKEAAQKYADTLTEGGAVFYVNPQIVCASPPDSTGNSRWVMVEHNLHTRIAFPGFSLQYSIEKSDVTFPLLFGAGMHFNFDGGIVFAAFSAGLGLKFPIY